MIEDKGLSLAVHYRGARRKKEARALILDAAAGLGDVRLVGGKQVLNVLPAGAPGKGQALERARARLGCDTAVYVGDDETDEDVFALDQPGRLLAIRVGRKRAPRPPTSSGRRRRSTACSGASWPSGRSLRPGVGRRGRGPPVAPVGRAVYSRDPP